MTASPKDLEELNVERERWRVEKALEHLQRNGVAQLTWLEGQRWQDVQRSMRHGPWHIFHFIGHGGFDVRMDEGILAFENDEGLSRARKSARHFLQHCCNLDQAKYSCRFSNAV